MLTTTEGNSISHKEYIALAANKGYVCTDWTEAIIQIKAYLPLLGALLGWYHPVVKQYRAGFKYLDSIQLSLRTALA